MNITMQGRAAHATLHPTVGGRKYFGLVHFSGEAFKEYHGYSLKTQCLKISLSSWFGWEKAKQKYLSLTPAPAENLSMVQFSNRGFIL